MIIFKHFSDVIFDLKKKLYHKVRGLIFFNDQALKNWTKDMYHTPVSQL